METLIKRLKNWVLSWDFVRREMYTKVMRDATNDILETFQGDVDKEAQVKAEKILADLLSPIDTKSIASVDKRGGLIYLGTDKADPTQLKNLKAEADFLLESHIWKILHETPKELAQKAMFVEGDSLDTLKKGRSMLYTLQTQKNIVDIFKGYKG